MPELLTKYPEVALKEFKDAKLACGKGMPQQILVNCPKDRFCALPTGELCIYGLNEVPQMTQIHELDLFLFPTFMIPYLALSVMIFLVGMMVGLKLRRKKR